MTSAELSHQHLESLNQKTFLRRKAIVRMKVKRMKVTKRPRMMKMTSHSLKVPLLLPNQKMMETTTFPYPTDHPRPSHCNNHARISY
jgi:hypothetical protein